jgi:glycosyltransferase involved in cell wall biosynthesis
MKNVLQFIGSFHQGGSEQQAVQLTRLLREDGTCNVRAATLNKEGVLLGEIEKLGLEEIPEFKLKSFYDANFLVQLKKCVRFLRENEIDIVQTHDFYTNVFGITAARLAGVKCKIAAKRETSQMRSKAQKIIEKRVFAIADRIVANSGAVEKYLINEGVSGAKINVIYNGIDALSLIPAEKNRKKILESFNLPAGENVKIITLVANLRHAVKNQSMFLRAAKRVIQKYPEAHFVLAGEGELQASLEAAATEMAIERNTHFPGRCTRVPELLSISCACVLTSCAEGFSNSILEYMAAEKPVVATRVGGASEAIVENETGFLVESDDDEAMANRLLELLADAEKAARFGRTAKGIVEEKFSLRSRLDKTLELYGFCAYDM